MSLIINEGYTLYGVWWGDSERGHWTARMDEPWFTPDRRRALAMCVNILAHGLVASDQIAVYPLGYDGKPMLESRAQGLTPDQRITRELNE